jgi:hypothetical protein
MRTHRHQEKLSNEQLKEALQDFYRERDQIRQMLGRIGGASDIRRHRALNWVILLVTIGLFTLEITTHILPVFISLEVGLLLVSLKIILLIQSMLKQNHFEFWMLHTIEYRINDLSERFDEIEKKLE